MKHDDQIQSMDDAICDLKKNRETPHSCFHFNIFMCLVHTHSDLRKRPGKQLSASQKELFLSFFLLDTGTSTILLFYVTFDTFFQVA